VLEDLKDRYYSIARKLMVAREGTDATLLNQHLLRNPYNANQGMSVHANPCTRSCLLQSGGHTAQLFRHSIANLGIKQKGNSFKQG
jgi:hypothetical protein